MTRMNADIARFIQNGERDGHDAVKTAHALFRLLVRFGKTHLGATTRS